jgi:hypothetical protein
MDEVLYLPRELNWIAAMDWGFHARGCIGWAAVLPGHRIHLMREWAFTEIVDEEIAAGFHQRTKDLGIKVQYVAGDPSMWIRDGRNAHRGQSRAETFIRAGMPMRKAENAREDGWSRLHSFLRVPRDADGQVLGDPLLTIDETCRYLRRSIPAQQSDKTNADDVDTKGDDHGVDMLRYLAMSRPNPASARPDPIPPVGTWGHEVRALLVGTGRKIIGSDNVRARG